MLTKKLLLYVGLALAGIGLTVATIVYLGGEKDQTAALTEFIKKDFQRKMDREPEYKEFEVAVLDVSLTETGSGQYDGTVTVLFDYDEYAVTISAWAKGRKWELGPGALDFLNAAYAPMLFVKGGAFFMGCTDEQGDDCYNKEKPEQIVTVDDFLIGKYPVTQKQWKHVMEANPSKFEGDDLPVEQVSWYDTQEFIEKLNRMTGKRYRLLTEAEWEYAARGGEKSKGAKYAGGDNIDNIAWYSVNSGEKTHPVGAKNPNELGIHDMSGNVWEWVQDRYGVYTEDEKTNPAGPPSGSTRVNRGGSWDGDARHCRVSNRSNNSPESRYNSLGLRLARTPKPVN